MSHRATIQSYQRIFRPERRVYAIDGRRLPVPGGVPLRWLVYAVGALVAVLLLASRPTALYVVVALAAAVCGRVLGGTAVAVAAGAAALGGMALAGMLVAALDWPLRLVVLPVGVATLGVQATPDGRSAHRFAVSWLLLRARPGRRSLGRRVPAADAARHLGARVWVARDMHGPRLRRARVHGPVRVRLAQPMTVTRGLVRRRIRTARRQPAPASARRARTTGVELAAGETLELLP
jgi:TcpE family